MRFNHYHYPNKREGSACAIWLLVKRAEQSRVGVIQHHIFYPGCTCLASARVGVTEQFTSVS